MIKLKKRIDKYVCTKIEIECKYAFLPVAFYKIKKIPWYNIYINYLRKHDIKLTNSVLKNIYVGILTSINRPILDSTVDELELLWKV